MLFQMREGLETAALAYRFGYFVKKMFICRLIHNMSQKMIDFDQQLILHLASPGCSLSAVMTLKCRVHTRLKI